MNRRALLRAFLVLPVAARLARPRPATPMTLPACGDTFYMVGDALVFMTMTSGEHFRITSITNSTIWMT